jgi:hypothetical protein
VYILLYHLNKNKLPCQVLHLSDRCCIRRISVIILVASDKAPGCRSVSK